MADFTMPALGADMETGKIVAWQVKPGDRVHPGDVVAVVETHKGAIDVECFLDGVITDLAPLGQPMPVGALLARVQPVGQTVDFAQPATMPAPVPAPADAAVPGQAAVLPATVVAAPTEARADVDVLASAAAAPVLPSQAAAPQVGAVGPLVQVGRPRVSPLARRRAGELGVALAGLPGSGADGAVVLADVERAARSAKAGTPEPAQAVTPSRKTGFDPAQMRQAIASAMSRSKREIPHYYLVETINFAAAQRWLDDWNGAHEPIDRLLPAVLLLKATARALREVPQLNGFYENGAFRACPDIHPGWAIALRGGGLIAPALHHADRQTLPQLMAALRDLVQRARSAGLRSSELTDASITVTSLGERGAEAVLGVIYPPQVAIVGFGRVTQRPWVIDGQVRPCPLLSVSLAADHRVSDGHLGGQLLAAINAALQSPDTL